MSLPIFLVEPADSSSSSAHTLPDREGHAVREGHDAELPAEAVTEQPLALVVPELTKSTTGHAPSEEGHPVAMDAELDVTIDLLNDADLFRLEARLGEEYFQRELLLPGRRDTTFLVLKGSAGLLRAWTRWHEASILLTRRCLPTWRRNAGEP